MRSKKIKTRSKKSQIKNAGGSSQEHRRLEILIEDLHDDVKVIVEQYGDVKKDIHEIKNTLGSHTETLASHTEILNSHTGTLNLHTKILKSHSATLKSHTGMIGNLAVDVAIVKEDVAFIKGDLKKKVDFEEFVALERRTALMEKRL